MPEAELVLGGRFGHVAAEVVKAAKAELLVAMYVWKWYPGREDGGPQSIAYLVMGAARAGVKVSVLLGGAGMGSSVNKWNGEASHNLTRAGAKVKIAGGSTSVHAKIFLADREVGVVGSHNMTRRAMGGSMEVGMWFQDPRMGAILGEYFDRFWSLF